MARWHQVRLVQFSDDALKGEDKALARRIIQQFLADLAAILRTSSRSRDETKQKIKQDRSKSDAYINRQAAMDCLRVDKVQFARNFIQRHAPEQMDWLESQIGSSKPQAQIGTDLPRQSAVVMHFATVPVSVRIDAEAGRIARGLGQFSLFRAWAWAMLPIMVTAGLDEMNWRHCGDM